MGIVVNMLKQNCYQRVGAKSYEMEVHGLV